MKLLIALGSAAILAGAPVHAQTRYPTKPVRIVIGFGPGSAADLIGRVLAQKLEQIWATSLIVDAKAGAAGLLATQDVARAAPDGHTLLLAVNSQISLPPSTNPNFPVAVLKELAPVTVVATSDLSFAVSSEHVPVKTFQEYLEWARRRGSLFLGDFGKGSITDLAAAYFATLYHLKYEPVHYQSTADIVTGNFRGDVQGMFFSTASVVPHQKSGKMRVLGTTGATRSLSFPHVPTFREMGSAELEIVPWYGLFAPARTPPELLDTINAAMAKALKSPEVAKKLEEIGFTPDSSSPSAFAELVRDDTERWARIVKAVGYVGAQ
ncbi:tripartite tricarboxylate transporter substrate binding protein [Pigmentiphaga soli]|uniref:Tripartite tricarboxylate transporter substrate binding protein n=1 Tax=Pigmentiphaga soli TaxID=1007095 RepID=A0ABP8GLR8_9BURK